LKKILRAKGQEGIIKMLVTNYSFNSEIKGDSMIFSYKLHSGICNNFNANELMKKSGIKILSNIIDK